MGNRAFEHLRVYQLAEKLANHVWRFGEQLADAGATTRLVSRLIRAGDSIGANIAEDAGRGTYQDNRRFVRIGRGSLYETMHFLRLAYKRELLDKKQVAELKPLVDALGPTLNAYLKSIGRKRESDDNASND